MERQIREHKIEYRGIELVRQWAEIHGISFKDVHNDYSTGIDIILDGKPYDLKVTNSNYLTFVKKYQSSWYCPLELHTEVPYLILQGTKGFVLDKKLLFDFCTTQSIISGIQLGIYVLDGNVNITFNAERFLNKTPDFEFNFEEGNK